MRLGTFGPRLLAGLALLVGLLATTAIAGAAQEVGTLTIYKTACPAGYTGTDFYDDCYDNPVTGQAFSAEQGKSSDAPAIATTGANGFATLPLYGGATIISEGLPAGIADYFVYCAKDDGTVVEFEYTGDTFGIFLEEEGGDYAAGDDLRCDWYNVPAGDGGSDGGQGTLTVYRVACPAGYQGDDYYDDCYDNPTAGADFGIRPAGSDSVAGFSTGPDGAALAHLGISRPATLIVIDSTGSRYDGQPIEYLDYVVNCTKNGGEPVAIDYGQPGVMDIVFDATPDDAIACDWFYVPPAGSDGGDDGDGDETGTLTVYATACPAGYDGDDFFEECYGNPVSRLEFGVFDFKTDFSATDTTGANGFATLPIPDTNSGGELTLGQVPPGEVPGGGDPPFVVYCTENGGDDVVDLRYSLVQLDPGGDAYTAALAVEPGDTVRCDWYLLTTGEQDGDDGDGTSGGNVSGVVTLPNTGAVGAAGRAGNAAWIGLASLAALAAGAAVARRRVA